MNLSQIGEMRVTSLIAAKHEYDFYRPTLPLELQEKIIQSGPQDNPDRVIFLCHCALVCKDWLLISRPALALRIGPSHKDCLSLIDLVASPMMTLAHAIREVCLRWDIPIVDERLLSMPATFQRLPSICDLSLWGGIISAIISMMVFMPNVRVLALRLISLTLREHIPTLLAYFPNLESLTLDQEFNLSNKVPLLGPSAEFMIPVISLELFLFNDYDLQCLVPIIEASPFLQRLTLHPGTFKGVSPTSKWLSRCTRDFLSSLYLSIDLTCGTYQTDHAALDIILDAVHELKINWSLFEGTDYLVNWIQRSPHLQVLTIENFGLNLYEPIGTVQCINWGPLVRGLERATHVKEVRFFKWGTAYRRAPGYMQSLKALVPPHVSVSVQTMWGLESQGCNTEIMEVLVE